MPGTDNKVPGPQITALEDAMERRRVELRMSWRDVSTTAGMSYEGLRAIRKGERHPNPVTKGRIEDALQWTPGSVDMVLAGGQPTVKTRSNNNSAADLRQELRDLREQLAAILRRIDEIQDR